MGTSWSDPAPAPRRLVAMRFEVDEPDVDADPIALERLAQAMEGYAVNGARVLGGVVRDRRLYIDRRGELHELAPLDGH